MKLTKKMVKDKGYDVEYQEKVWVVDKYTHKGKWKKQKAYGTYLGYDSNTMNHQIKTSDGSIIQNNKYKKL